MLSEQRQALILKYLEERKSITVGELTGILDIIGIHSQERHYGSG